MTTASVFNSVRKNISLLTRALPSASINTSSSTANKFNDVLYYKVAGLTIASPSSKMDTNNAKSLIVEGGDIYIDTDITKDASVTHPRALIAIKDAAGNGGNIYIKNTVKNIYSSLIAEGSVYSGDSAANLYNDTISKLTTLPKNQLYIYGSVVSRNTIGGSARTPVSCPFIEATCSYASALKYDWNYFRSYDTVTVNRSDKAGYDDYSIVIEYDTRMLENAPPGMSR